MNDERSSPTSGAVHRLRCFVVSTWHASQEAQLASSARVLGSLGTLAGLFVLSAIIYLTTDPVVFTVWMLIALPGFVLVTAALHHRDQARSETRR